MPPTYAPGHVIAGRYRVVELLGVGNTVEVYRAEDTSLQRVVVVKVLVASLAVHEDVRRAFRDHIVRAATLSHPHLARVFDGGQEAGAMFMVTEYLAGGSLEEALNQGHLLSVDDAARLGRDVASALAYAHENGFVLGALSPTKLLFDAEGQVRVSDVALAGLSSGYREHLSVADARYLSPEQAIGEAADAKSDVYALALILFEAVTGSVAFEGTSAEAVLRARLSAPLPVRVELGTLDMILAQATVPDAQLRLDAEGFSSRLGGVVSDQAPFTLAGPGAAVPLLARFTPNEPRTSIGFRAPSADQIVSSANQPRVRPARPGAGPGRHEAGAILDRDFRRAPRRRLGALIVAAVLLLLAIGAGAAWRLGVFTTSHAVPSLVGLTYQQAGTTVAGDGFTLSESAKVHSATAPPNTIVAQSPAGGTVVKSGATITVTVSDGPLLVTLPTNLVGQDCVSDTATLAKLHVNAQCPSTESIYSASVHSGKVARVLYKKTPNPVAVPANATVVLQLSKGPNPATTTTTTTPPGATTTTTPSSATTTTTSTTTTTTTAPTHPKVAVPNVVGMDQAQVYAAFKKAQLYFTTSGPGAGTTKWTKVLSEVPAAGTLVAWHSSVSLNVN
ncbi:MAG: protein kinase [Acidobacteriota bacterium]|nr:protein kinase [Acidobacteriota bacterium]